MIPANPKSKIQNPKCDPIEPLDYVRIEPSLMDFAECCETGWQQHLGRRLTLRQWLSDPELCGYCVRDVQFQNLVLAVGFFLFIFDLKERSVRQQRVVPKDIDSDILVEILWPFALVEGLFVQNPKFLQKPRPDEPAPAWLV